MYLRFVGVNGSRATGYIRRSLRRSPIIGLAPHAFKAQPITNSPKHVIPRLSLTKVLKTTCCSAMIAMNRIFQNRKRWHLRRSHLEDERATKLAVGITTLLEASPISFLVPKMFFHCRCLHLKLDNFQTVSLCGFSSSKLLQIP